MPLDVASFLFMGVASMRVQFGKATLDTPLARYLGWSGLTQLAAGIMIWCQNWLFEDYDDQVRGRIRFDPSFPKYPMTLP
jgi:hypothetical protein